MRIGEIILHRRKELNMTQKELAEKINVTDRTISRWECLVNLPDVETLKTIAKVLDVNISYFYEDVQEKEINYKEQYDYDVIKSFKLKAIAPFIILAITLIVLICAKIIIFNITLELGIFSNFHNMLDYFMEENMHYQLVTAIILMLIGIFGIVLSLVLYLKNTITFKCFFKQKMYQTAYLSIYRKIKIIYTVVLILLILIFLI